MSSNVTEEGNHLHDDLKIDTYLENVGKRESPTIVESQHPNRIYKYFQTAT